MIEMRYRLFCVVRLLAFALIPFAAMAVTPSPSPLPSGIEGIILVSPSRPGPTRKDQPSAAPAPNLAFVVKKAEARVAAFTTDEQGHFRVSLPPGQYIVLREDPGAKIGHWRFEAEVKPAEVTTVRWVGDSGMR